MLQAFGQTNSKANSKTVTKNNYVNEVYRLSVSIPENWRLYGQIKNDTLKHMSIVDWRLPKNYSKVEKTEIENSISIKSLSER